MPIIIHATSTHIMQLPELMSQLQLEQAYHQFRFLVYLLKFQVKVGYLKLNFLIVYSAEQLLSQQIMLLQLEHVNCLPLQRLVILSPIELLIHPFKKLELLK